MAANFKNASNQTITPTAGQEYVLTVEGLTALAGATVTNITGPSPIQGGKSITFYTGAGDSTTIGVGSAITFSTYTTPGANDA